MGIRFLPQVEAMVEVLSLGPNLTPNPKWGPNCRTKQDKLATSSNVDPYSTPKSTCGLLLGLGFYFYWPWAQQMKHRPKFGSSLVWVPVSKQVLGPVTCSPIGNEPLGALGANISPWWIPVDSFVFFGSVARLTKS